MQSVHSTPKEEQWMVRQRRPAAVARFLNTLPLNDRHGATNALLVLGLRAYEKALPNASANLEALCGVVSQSASDFRGTQTSLACGGTPPKETDYSSLHEDHQRTMLNATANHHEQHQQQQQQQHQEPFFQHSHHGALRSLSSSSQRKIRAPALSFVLEEAKRPTSSYREGEEEGEKTTAVAKDFSALDVNEGTVSAVGSRNSMRPQSSGMREEQQQQCKNIEEDVFPLEFLVHIRKHIERTRGVRENLISLAASIPQELAVHTTRDQFADLYQSYLVAYHLSAGATKD